MIRYNEHYTWNKVTTCIHNLLGGQRWVDHYGETVIENQPSGIKCKLTYAKVPLQQSSSSQAFPIIWGRRNGVEYHSSTLSNPVRPPPLYIHSPYLFYTSLSTWFSVFLSISFLVLVHLTFLLVCALRPFS